ncbi:MAG: SMI1/KNR4 family protein [Clostridia bacterium]|nr:SMI1/KNR4 family protein [Clostridia bacterium]
MAIERWARVKALKNTEAIVEAEKKYGVTLSAALKNCIVENNGGRPVPNAIKLANGEENDVKILLSYNAEDIENIYKVISYFVNEYKGSVVPFASDSEGNYYCEMNGKVVLWYQDGDIVQAANSFSEFLNSLYSI